jgi:O-antigen/teichoic acid export membrane protein
MYFSNIAWSWIGFAAMVLSSALVMPMLIRRLGTAQYGIWALAISLVEYFWLIDLGFRPATVKLSAEFRAVNRLTDLNHLINTALAYSLAAGSLVLLVGWLSVDRVASILRIDDPSFGFLIRVVGISWAAGLVFNVFGAVLEGFQRFDLSNRITVLATIIRSTLSLALVMAGYGLREMAIALLISQTTSYLMTYRWCRRVHPEMRLSPAYVNVHMAWEIMAYARQVVTGVVGSRLSQAGLPTVIAYFRPVQFVTYFTQTQRLLDYAADGISRVAFVTAPRVTEWAARGQRQHIVDHARSANRYCLTLWGLPAAYLFVYGGALCRVWINEEFGNEAAVLFPVFLVGYTFWMGQFISAAVLMGIGRYTAFSFTLFVESVVVVAGVALTLPRFGLIGAASVVSACMIVSRTLVLSRLFAKEFELNQSAFLRDVFGRPLSLMAASIAALWICREWLLPGRGWVELIAAGLLYSTLYVAVAFWLVVKLEDRRYLLLKASQFWAKSRSLNPRQGVG